MKGLAAMDEAVDVRRRTVGPGRGLRRFPPAPVVPDTATLVRAVTDQTPAAGEDGPAHLLGRWADTLPRDAWDRRARAIATAALAFAASPTQPDRSPLRAWITGRPKPQPDLCLGSLAVARSPWWPYRIVAQEGRSGHRWWVAPLAGWGEGLEVHTPIDLAHAGGVQGGPAVGRVLMARLVAVPVGEPDPGALHAVLPLVLPEGAGALIEGAAASVHAGQGSERRRAEVLAAAGHLVVRLVHDALQPQ